MTPTYNHSRGDSPSAPCDECEENGTMSHTHTFAVLEISPLAYAEIKARFEEVGYKAVTEDGEGREVLDMHGVALWDGRPAPSASDVEKALVRRMRALEAEKEQLIAENEALKRRVRADAK
jgi:hypothetical protein